MLISGSTTGDLGGRRRRGSFSGRQRGSRSATDPDRRTASAAIRIPRAARSPGLQPPFAWAAVRQAAAACRVPRATFARGRSPGPPGWGGRGRQRRSPAAVGSAGHQPLPVASAAAARPLPRACQDPAVARVASRRRVRPGRRRRSPGHQRSPRSHQGRRSPARPPPSPPASRRLSPRASRHVRPGRRVRQATIFFALAGAASTTPIDRAAGWIREP